jgi:hypothetical protein
VIAESIMFCTDCGGTIAIGEHFSTSIDGRDCICEMCELEGNNTPLVNDEYADDYSPNNGITEGYDAW